MISARRPAVDDPKQPKLLNINRCGCRAVLLVRNLIETAKLNGIDPQSWLTDVRNRIADHKIKRIISFLIQKFLPGVGA